ncbi:uncharacterized protein DUF3499 [Tamaricihabitans halophyticus]|uniref:Uncharacterized protein DUF3499 n=1 Tax=Tamaricihabitans halophyticus TaxID=1262583 RepID=A0A4R2QQD4_9PSEU|nr:uncharacterized protein DUF3499 [Tamaricihabitans halophyticus]
MDGSLVGRLADTADESPAKRLRAGHSRVPATPAVRDALSSAIVRCVRKCSRTGCQNAAVATLTYAYADSTAVVGPLATSSEPHSYDLCAQHAGRLTVPKGWEVVRYEGEFGPEDPSNDDLTALAEAVREAGSLHSPVEQPEPEASSGRRGHLRVLPTPSD